MLALCAACKRTTPAEYRIERDVVKLVTQCITHGSTSTIVSTDPDYFNRALSAARVASERGGRTAGLIVELLDGCNMRCPTCIAGSGPELTNLRSPSVVTSYFDADTAQRPVPAVLLSGGEPTIHPELTNFMDAVEDHRVPRRIIITNGARVADGTDVTRQIFAERVVWEVFLQFDSLRESALMNLRGGDLRDLRRRALNNLAEFKIPTTLVCVVKNGVNDDEIHSLLTFALAHPNVVGVQFQPMKLAGRADGFQPSERGNATDVRRSVCEFAGADVLEPHPASPLSVGLAAFDRISGEWSIGSLPPSYSEYFIDETRAPDGRLRVSVVEYADPQDWTSLRAANSPYDVLEGDGSAVPVDNYFLRDFDILPGAAV